MKKLLGLALIASSLLLAGCASPPQAPLTLSGTALPSPGAQIGVAMSPLPKVDTSFPGAGCLLCLAAASVANSSLTTHTQTLPSDDMARLKADVAALLRKKGQNAVVIEEAIKIDDLPKLDAAPNKARRDFSALRNKYQVDKLLVIEVGQLGVTRSYAAYIPSGDPQGVVDATAYLVNLADNSYEWYQPIRQVKSAAGKWDEAPKFPGLSNAYFQAVEGARDAVLQPFAN